LQIEALIERNPTPNPASSPLMSGRWTMAWTTEKEILFLVEKGFFGLKCNAVYQVKKFILKRTVLIVTADSSPARVNKRGALQDIDAAAGTLANALIFDEDSYLKASPRPLAESWHAACVGQVGR
jgi:hypothetical protein